MRKHIDRFTAEWLSLGLLLLLVAALLGWALYRDHVSVQASEGDRLEVQARVVDESVIRQLEGAKKALDGVGDELKVQDISAYVPALTSQLKLLTGAMSGVSSMLVLNAEGTVVAASLDDLVGKNFKQRTYFDMPFNGTDRALLYVSPPFTSTRGTYVMVMSRALTNERGQFNGVIAATLDRSYFNVVLRSVLYAQDMRTTLIHRDGKVFLNMPVNPAALGLNLNSPDSLFSKHLQTGQPSTLTMGKVLATGDQRMVAMRTIDRADLHLDKPMIVSVSREVGAIFLRWREKAWQFGILFAVLLIGSSGALVLHQRRRRAFDLIQLGVAQERQRAAERVDLALRGADLGLWDLHVPTDTFVINARERALLGYSDDDELPQGRQWRKLIHPDDRELVDASILPHLRGETVAYGCEHRMRHKDGHYVWLSNRAMIVERDAKGAPIRIVGTHLDVSERKRNEEQLALSVAMLRDREEEMRLVTDNMPALVSRLDVDQRFRFVNRTYADWLKIEPASMLGRSLSEVYGEKAYSAFRHNIEKTLTGQKVTYQREMRTPDGVLQVELTLVPQVGRDGEVKGFYALAIDMTASHEAQMQRARSEERLSLALEGSSLALFDWDIAADTIYHSAQAAAMRGEPAIESTTSAVEQQGFVHPDDLPWVLAQLKEAVVGKTPLYHAEFRLKTAGGDWLWVRARGRVVQRDSAGRALRLAGTYADINDRKLAESRLRRLAEFDTLTGLPNRALFYDRLQQAMARAARGKPMALLFLDVDHFKFINDTMGHEAGDHLLKIFATRMQACVRQSDTVARLAGDEFVVILEAIRDLNDAKMLAAKLIEALRQPIVLEEHTLEVTASIGVALCTPGEADDAALLRRADLALYEAKRLGRNGYHCDES